MISATEANKLRSNIQRVLRGLGTTNGTKLPATKQNSGETALRYWLMSTVSKMVRGLMEEAKRNAIKEGVIFDSMESPLPAGTEKLVYASDVVNVTVKVSRASKVFDKDEAKRNLRKAGVKQEVIDRAFEDAFGDGTPAHNFSATLNEKLD